MRGKSVAAGWAVLAMFVMLFGVLAGTGQAGEAGLAGWEHGGAYGKLFDTREADSFKGRVLKIMDVTPLPGMAPGIAIVVEDKKDKIKETAHLGPKAYVDLGLIGLKEGDQVKVVGSWAEIGGQDVMLATKVKKDENVEIKVRRTKDGFPYWDMSPAEREKEKSGD